MNVTFYVTYTSSHNHCEKNQIQKQHISVKKKMTNYVKICDQSKDVEKIHVQSIRKWTTPNIKPFS